MQEGADGKKGIGDWGLGTGDWVSGVGCRVWAAFCLSLLPLAFALFLAGCSQPETPAPPATIHTLAVRAPAQVAAGDPISVTVSGDGDGPLFLLATGTFGSVPLTGTLTAGTATLRLDALYSRHAGAVEFRARAGQAEAQAATTILPGPPVDPILPLVGPRSIVADRGHWTMLVAVPTDRYGNPLTDGFPVTVRAQHPAPDGGEPLAALDVQEAKIERLFAWARVYSRTKAGRTFLSVNAGEASSPEREVQEVPGQPVPFRLYAEPEVAVADGRQTVQISSEQIRDRYGNLLLDGTSVQLLAESSHGSRRMIPAVTQDGRIYASLQSPAAPGTLAVWGLIDGVVSEVLTLRFTPGPAVRPFPVAISQTGGTLFLSAGPLLGPIGQFIPDGTAVRFTLTDPDSVPQDIPAVAEYGYARISLGLGEMAGGEYRVEAAVGTGQGWNGFWVRR